MTEVMDICQGCPAPCCFNRLVPLTEEEAQRLPSFEFFSQPFLKLNGTHCPFLDQKMAGVGYGKIDPKPVEDMTVERMDTDHD